MKRKNHRVGGKTMSFVIVNATTPLVTCHPRYRHVVLGRVFQSRDTPHRRVFSSRLYRSRQRMSIGRSRLAGKTSGTAEAVKAQADAERRRDAAIVQSAKVTWRVVTYIVLCRYTRSRRIYLRYTTA